MYLISILSASEIEVRFTSSLCPRSLGVCCTCKHSLQGFAGTCVHGLSP